MKLDVYKAFEKLQYTPENLEGPHLKGCAHTKDCACACESPKFSYLTDLQAPCKQEAEA